MKPVLLFQKTPFSPSFFLSFLFFFFLLSFLVVVIVVVVVLVLSCFYLFWGFLLWFVVVACFASLFLSFNFLWVIILQGDMCGEEGRGEGGKEGENVYQQ